MRLGFALEALENDEEGVRGQAVGCRAALALVEDQHSAQWLGRVPAPSRALAADDTQLPDASLATHMGQGGSECAFGGVANGRRCVVSKLARARGALDHRADLSPMRDRTRRRVKLRKSVWGLAGVVLATGCGATGTVAPEFNSASQGQRITDARHGYSMALPGGWYRARSNLTPQLLDPREILAVATYPLRYQRRARCYIAGCPTPALNGFRATDILMSIQYVYTRGRRPKMSRSI